MEAFNFWDSLTFDSSLQGETITLTSGELAITDSVDIEGLENRDITISGNNSSRVFNINDNNDENQIEVNISQVTITEGRFTRNDDGYSRIFPGGGGISSAENLTIANSIITNNSSETNGGGVFSYYGDLTIDDSIITGNTSDISGSGIAIENGTLNVNRSTIENNSSSFLGGSIDNSSGEITIKDSLINNNQDSGIRSSGVTLIEESTISNNGGGIINDDLSSLTINNSNISGNSASSGGGLYNRATAVVNNSTVSNNQGGGIENSAFGTLEVNNR